MTRTPKRSGSAIGPVLIAAALSVLDSRQGACATAHADEVKGVVFESTGRWLVSTDEKTLKTWSLPAGKRVAAVQVAEGVDKLRASPTEPLVAILRGDNNVELRTVPDLKLLRSWKAGDTTQGLAFSADGKTLATLDHRVIQLWNTSAVGAARRIEVEESLSEVTFSPDGRWLAAAGVRDLMKGGPMIGVWQLSDLTRVGEIKTPYDQGHIFTLAFSPDGELLAVGSNNDQLGLWRVPTGAPVVIHAGHPKALWALAVTRDGKGLFTADHGRIRTWTLPDGSPRSTHEAHADQINSIAPSPDGATYATGGDDKAVRLWRSTDGSLSQTLIDAAPAPAVAAQPRAAKAAAPAARSTRAPTGRPVIGRLVLSSGKPAAGIDLKLPRVSPIGEGLFYSFGPDFLRATTGEDGRFRFEGAKPGERYALVTDSGGRVSPLKAADGSVVAIDVGAASKPLDLGDIPFGHR
jgi:hypothetical protein